MTRSRAASIVSASEMSPNKPKKEKKDKKHKKDKKDKKEKVFRNKNFVDSDFSEDE